MRIARLALTAFGPFEGAAIEFAAAGPSGVVDVIFGPNEAGKSTTLRAVGDLLFGIPQRSPDAHRHRTQDLLLGATLIGPLPDGERWDVVRSKGRKETLRTAAGDVADEAKLVRWLGGVKRDLFERAYGLDHVTLRRGAEELLSGKGDAAELLFAAALGRTGLLALEREFREQADALFTTRGKNPPLNQALKAYKEAKSRSEGTDRSAWEEQRAAVDDLKSQQRAASAERAQLVAERALVDKLLKVLPVTAALGRHAGVLVGAILALEQRLAQIPSDTAIATVASRVSALAERIPALRGAELDRPVRETERTALKAELSRIVHGIGTEARSERALAAVAAALEPLEALEARRRALEAQVREGRAELGVVSGPAAHDPEAEAILRRALDRFRALGDVAAQRRKLAKSIAKIEADLARLRKELPWEHAARVIPPSALVGEHERALAEADLALATARVSLASVEAELRERTQKRDELLAGGAPPTESDVRAARADRDQAYTELDRNAAARATFEAKLRRADDLADALRADLVRSTLLATLEIDLRALAATRARAEAAVIAATAVQTSARSSWKTIAMIDVSPAVFRGHMATHEEIVRRSDDLAQEVTLLDELDRAIADAAEALASACGEGTGDVDPSARAEARLGAIGASRTLAVRLAKDEAALAHAALEHEDARSRARAALVAASLPADASPREALAFLGKIADAERARAALSEADERIARATAERERAEIEIRELAQQTALEGAASGVALLDLADALIRRHRLEIERTSERATIAKELAAKRAEHARESEAHSEKRVEIAETISALGEKFVERGTDDQNHGALDARREAIDPEMDALDDRLRRIGQDIGGKQAGLDQMEATSLAVEASAEAEGERAKIRDLALRYARLRAGAVVLRREMERYRAANEAPVVRHAGELFRALTSGSFTSLRVDHDEKDTPILLAVREGGSSLEIAALSEGTRDQLYLALRLATLHRTAETTDPLPLVLDDVLVHFDDARARAAFSVLGEIAQRMQVILFTHHEHVAALAQSALGERAAVHRLR